MRSIEALNKVLVFILLGLVCLQASVLFVMKNMQDQAKVRLIENETPLDMKCGEAPFSDENYWSPLAREINTIETCKSWECEKSALFWKDKESPKNLHVVSVKSAPPMRWNEQEPGGTIRVRVPPSAKPQVLALSSESMHEWRLSVDPDANLEKIIVATPTIVWIDGVPEKTQIEYLPKEKMCSYPYAWEEVHNPDNEFRLFVGALKKITGMLPSSFQGAVIGANFVVPKNEKLNRSPIDTVRMRGLASVETTSLQEPNRVDVQQLVVWERDRDRVVGKYVLSEKKLEEKQLPDHTQSVTGNFILRKQMLYLWSAEHNDYKRVSIPLLLPPLEAMTAIASDDLNPDRIFIFNDAHGGEIYSYEQSLKKWTLIKSGIPSAVRSLFYDSKEKTLYGLASRGREFTDIIKLSIENPKDLTKKPLVAKIPFDPTRWKWEMVTQEKHLHLVLRTPLEPSGEVYKIKY